MVRKKTALGFAACGLGAGMVLSAILPSGALVFIFALALIGGGVVLVR